MAVSNADFWSKKIKDDEKIGVRLEAWLEKYRTHAENISIDDGASVISYKLNTSQRSRSLRTVDKRNGGNLVSQS